MRIYEVNGGYHLDLEKVAAIRQVANRTRRRTNDRSGRTSPDDYEYFVEVTLVTGKFLYIDCTIDNLYENYWFLLMAWKTYVGDEISNSDGKRDNKGDSKGDNAPR